MSTFNGQGGYTLGYTGDKYGTRTRVNTKLYRGCVLQPPKLQLFVVSKATRIQESLSRQYRMYAA